MRTWGMIGGRRCVCIEFLSRLSINEDLRSQTEEEEEVEVLKVT